jgi:hypothetical protein
MNHEPVPLHVELDVEITEVEASADLEGNDEPERADYETRLHSLHDAVVAVEKTESSAKSPAESSAELEHPDGSGPSGGTTRGS